MHQWVVLFKCNVTSRNLQKKRVSVLNKDERTYVFSSLGLTSKNYERNILKPTILLHFFI